MTDMMSDVPKFCACGKAFGHDLDPDDPCPPDPRGETHVGVDQKDPLTDVDQVLCECGCVFSTLVGFGSARQRHHAHRVFRYSLEPDTDDD